MHDDCFERHILPKNLDAYGYDELSALAVDYLQQLDLSEQADHLEWYRVSKPILNRLHFGKYRSVLGVLSPLAASVSELFLLSRVRSQMLAYLSVQESDDFESSDSNRGQLPEFMAMALGQLGKSLRARFAFRILGSRLIVDVDPFVHLRGLYLQCLQESRDQYPSIVRKLKRRTLICIHRLFFKVKMMCCGSLARLYAKRLSRIFLESGHSWFSERNVQYHLLLAVRNSFPNTAHLSSVDWKTITSECSRFLSERVKRLIDVIPEHSIQDDGLAKLLKVGAGVVAGRASRLDASCPTPEYIIETVKLAYSWGVTYPLVDNVLDSDSVSNDAKVVLHEVIRLAFDSDGIDLTAARNVAYGRSEIAEELINCFETVFAIARKADWERTRRVLLLLLESHRRDSARRLSEFDGNRISWESVWADTVLKAALVRWATMCICGIEVTPDDIRDGIEAAPFNQLGDDMWDVTEDEREDRATPFTIFRRFPTLPDPAVLYFATASRLCGKKTERQREAVCLGVCEVVGDCFHSGTLPGGLIATLKSHDPDFALTLRAACRVDPDAVLFAFGRAANQILT